YHDDKPMLLNIRLLLQTLGIESSIKSNEDKTYYILVIDANNLSKLLDLGYTSMLFKGGTVTLHTTNGYSHPTITVTKVKKMDEKEDTYCFNEPKRHMGMFNGILTGNCTEVVQYTSKDEVAVCSLSSLSLPKCVVDGAFDFNILYDTAYQAIINLNRIIDENEYPLPEAKHSTMLHRPVGLGVSGLADVFFMLKLPYDCEEAQKLNHDIFETIYYAAARSSCDLAKKDGAYATFAGSPASQGLLCPDLWGHKTTNRWSFD